MVGAAASSKKNGVRGVVTRLWDGVSVHTYVLVGVDGSLVGLIG